MGILRNIISYASVAILLTGCYRDFTGDIEVTPVLCINSLITAGQPIEVSVTHTWKYPDVEFDNSNTPNYDNKVTDAAVEIYVNDKLQKKDYLAQEGDHIKIVATSRKYGKAIGEVTVPVSAPIESLIWNANLNSIRELEDFWGGENYCSISFHLKASLTIKDTLDVENYYHVSYSPEYEGEEDIDKIAPRFSMGTFKYQSEPIFAEHIGVIDAATGMDAYGFTFFTDRQFSGDSYTLNLEFEDMEIQTFQIPPEDSDYDWSICFELSTISKSYYNLANYEWHAKDGSIADLGNIGLGESMWGYSNVSTGAGVLAAKSSATYKINLKDFFISEMEQ